MKIPSRGPETSILNALLPILSYFRVETFVQDGYLSQGVLMGPKKRRQVRYYIVYSM
jgi:hypothetical protein